MKFVEAIDRICIIALRRRATGGASSTLEETLRSSADGGGVALSRDKPRWSIQSKELGSRRPKAAVGATSEDTPDEAKGVGSC
jgi:hypothetical protein